ncbi:MAG TPA: hypothetical protein VEU76_05065, partial [Candidatus Udaeobacter sp.]|nr:hypothetical protein [Candidatus Udaeobacter sp.]
MEIDSRKIRRLIRQKRTHERTLDRVVRGQRWLDTIADATQRAIGAVYGAMGSPGRAIKDALHGTT